MLYLALSNKEVIKIFDHIPILFRVNMALMYGAYMLGQSLSYAPGVNSAKTAASRIVSVITRLPNVRTEDGIKDKLDWVRTLKHYSYIIKYFPQICLYSITSIKNTNFKIPIFII